jgi:hypothetical protein
VPLSSFGLLLATAMSVTNVLTDVARKHALEKRDLVPATFWMRIPQGSDSLSRDLDKPSWPGIW